MGQEVSHANRDATNVQGFDNGIPSGRMLKAYKELGGADFPAQSIVGSVGRYPSNCTFAQRSITRKARWFRQPFLGKLRSLPESWLIKNVIIVLLLRAHQLCEQLGRIHSEQREAELFSTTSAAIIFMLTRKIMA